MRYVVAYLLRRSFPLAEEAKIPESSEGNEAADGIEGDDPLTTAPPKDPRGGVSKKGIPMWHTERPEEERRSIVEAAKTLGPREFARRITAALQRRAAKEDGSEEG